MIIFILIVSLYLSSRNITSVGASLKFVKGEVERTTLYEFIDAFGMQFFLIFVGLFLLIKNRCAKVLLSILLVGAILFCKVALFPIVILLCFNIYRIHEDVKSSDDYLKDNKKLVFETLGVVSLLLWAIPEIVYLQDGYGVLHARMNTIFKIYSANWAISFLFVFYLIRRVLEKYKESNKENYNDNENYNSKNKQVVLTFNILFSFISLISVLCFFKLIDLRKTDYKASFKERSAGLIELNKIDGGKFSGVKNTIEDLRTRERGVVLEATNGAYNYASHVGTLSGNTSYLGWINHVGLLYKNHDDINIRKQNIDDFYTKMSCSERKTVYER
ncbi:MAG: DUF2298 domain-containing protein [Bdellovibrionota bacterium]